MTNTKGNNFAHVAAVLIALLIVGYLVFINVRQPDTAIGSVTLGSEYQSTTTDATFNTVTYKNLCISTPIAGCSGSLSNVTVTTVGNNSLIFYDATTSIAANRTNTATTTLAKFQTVGTVGTYTFDALFRYGLLVEVVGTNVASTTITYRQSN